MIRRLALELTNVEARALVVAASESRVTVERSLVVPLADDGKADQAASEQKVVDALTAAGLARFETIAVVGRADVELRLLSMPPTPDEELPNLVRFQASQELPNLDAAAALDYLPLGEDPGEPRRVLAAVLKPGVKQRLERICQASKLTLVHVVLRSAASASLVLDEKPELGEGCWLLAEILGRRVELAAVRRRQIVFLRHVLLPDDPTESDEAAESFFAEIRRTRVVVANQENGQAVETVVLVGEGQPRRALAERLAAAVDTRVVLVDPLPKSMVIAPSTTLSQQDRDFSTGLVGAVVDEAAGRRPALDFLHPRQPPKPPSRRGTYVLVGVIAAMVVLALLVFNHVRAVRLDRAIREKDRQLTRLKPLVKKAETAIAAADQVDAWVGNEVVWLDELRWLSERFPTAADARLTTLGAFSNERGRGMTLSGLARDADAKAVLDRSLQDATHQLLPQTSEDRGGERYQITFGSAVRIKSPPDSDATKPNRNR